MVKVSYNTFPIPASGVNGECLPKRATLVVALMYGRLIGLLDGAPNRKSGGTVGGPSSC